MFEPDPETKEMTVVSIHPGVTREQIQENTGWPVRYAGEVDETPAPDAPRSSRCCASSMRAPRGPTASGVKEIST